MHIKQVYLKLTWCIDKAVHTIEDYPMARLDNKTTSNVRLTSSLLHMR